jgi:hypothetical protein
MITFVQDTQVVGETESTLWATLVQGPVDLLLTIKNSGVNTMNYRLQEFNGSAWVDLGDSGSDFNNTLQANQVKTMKVASSFNQVQMVGNASGGAFLEFGVQRYFNRASGGNIPILSL